MKIFYLPGNIFGWEGPSSPLSLEKFQRYLARFHPRRLLELLAEGGDLPPEKSVETRGGGPDVGVVDHVAINILVADCSHAVTALQLVGELPSRPEKSIIITDSGGKQIQPVEKYWMEY